MTKKKLGPGAYRPEVARQRVEDLPQMVDRGRTPYTELKVLLGFA